MFYMPDRNLYIYGSDHNKLCYEINLISILSYVIDFYIDLSIVLRPMLFYSIIDEYEMLMFVRKRIIKRFLLTQR